VIVEEDLDLGLALLLLDSAQEIALSLAASVVAGWLPGESCLG